MILHDFTEGYGGHFEKCSENALLPEEKIQPYDFMFTNTLNLHNQQKKSICPKKSHAITYLPILYNLLQSAKSNRRQIHKCTPTPIFTFPHIEYV